ncbi:MAG: hypothetical protein HFE45_03135 [Oscillospiraceae bacterium]|jgi:hypothetical protein|nr:hypothetical protein [Oscillospiraceae bacterium]
MAILNGLVIALTLLFSIGCTAKIAYLAVSAMTKDDFSFKKFIGQVKNLLTALVIALAVGSAAVYTIIQFYF